MQTAALFRLPLPLLSLEFRNLRRVSGEKLSCGLHPKERSSKGNPGAVPILYLGPAPNHPSVSVPVLTKDSKSILTTWDVAWLDMKQGNRDKASPIKENGGGKTSITF